MSYNFIVLESYNYRVIIIKYQNLIFYNYNVLGNVLIDFISNN